MTVSKDYFRVLHSDVTVYNGSALTTVYQEPITIDFEGEETITDFNNATDVGTYRIDINESDAISNSPVMTDETTRELRGILQVVSAGNNIYQEVVQDDNLLSHRRNRINGTWTAWRTI